MQSAKKMKTLSALSMAAMATIGAKAASGATLNLFYDNTSVNSAVEGIGTFGTGTPFTANSSGSATTITITVGQVLDFGIDAVVTGNTNPDAGKNTGTAAGRQVQPSNLGLVGMGIKVSSTDTNASKLVPNDDGTGVRATIGTVNHFDTTAYLNLGVGSNAGQPGAAGDQGPNSPSGSAHNGTVVAVGKNGGGGFAPNFNGSADVGDTAPGDPAAGGNVGLNFQIFGGSDVSKLNAANATGVKQLQNLAGTAATFAQATEFFDSLQYTATGAGLVTLSPFADSTATSYWSLTAGGTSSAASKYAAQKFTLAGDTINALPVLVVQIVPGGSSTHPLISLTTSAPASNYGVQITNGAGANQGTFTGPGAAANKLTVVGAGGNYKFAQATGIKDGSSNVNGPSTDYIQADGFSPATDEEVFALDVLVNGVQANQAQLNALVTAINTVGGLPAGASVTTVVPSPDPFPSNYNLFIDPPATVGGFLGFDFSNANDSNLTGYTVSAVAVVPEPMSLGLLALGGVSLMARRNRRKA